MVANDYTVAIVNTRTGTHIVASVFQVLKPPPYEFIGGGVCLFFDIYERLLEVIASEDDIVIDFSMYTPRGTEYYCILGDNNIMTKSEVLDLFNGIRDGHIQVISTYQDKVKITMSNN